MAKKRGPYKKFLKDGISEMPRSTKYKQFSSLSKRSCYEYSLNNSPQNEISFTNINENEIQNDTIQFE